MLSRILYILVYIEEDLIYIMCILRMIIYILVNIEEDRMQPVVV